MKINLKKIVAFGLLAVVTIIIAASVIVYGYKDDIAKNLLLGINTYTKGELQIRDININPLVHFPNISLTLNEPRYFEKKTLETDSLNHQIFHFSKLHVAFDLFELLDSRIDITAISADNGSVSIIQQEDSAFNIIAAFQRSDTIKITDGEFALPGDTTLKNANISISIRQLKLNEVDVGIDFLTTQQKQLFTIHQAKVSFKFVSDSIECSLNAEFQIDRIGLDNNIFLEDEELAIGTEFFYDRIDEEINIYQSDIEFANAQFRLHGFVDLKQYGWMNLTFEANDEELQFTKLFLTSEGINNLKQGDLYLNGDILGAYKKDFPNVSMSFGANNLKIQIPNSSKYLDKLTVEGNFSSGDRPDFSGATLTVDTLTALLPTGYINGAARIKNLKTPEIIYDLNASFRLDNLNQLFELGPLENLSGGVVIYDKYHGSYSEKSGLKDLSPESFFLELDSVSFHLREIMDVDLLDGVISGNLDSLQVTNLDVKTQNSDILINGALHDFSNLIYNKTESVKAELSISSKLFDFPEFFSFLSEVAQSFPYTISDINLEVDCKTSFDRLTKFNRTPELNFDIHEVSGTINSLLPPARVTGGTFNMYEIDSTSILDFSDFDIEVADAFARANYTLYNIPAGIDSMEIHLVTDGINPSKLFYDANDTIPKLIDASIRGNFICSIVLPEDSLKLFDAVNFHAEDFYYYGHDSLSSTTIHLKSTNIAYDNRSSLSLFATLSLSSDIDFKDLKTSVFQTESLNLAIDIKDGEYTIIPDDHQHFGNKEQGMIKLHPFDDPPRYHLEYSIQELPLEDLLASFYSEKLFTGDVDLSVDLTSAGNDLEEITSGISGNIILEGDSLKLIGLNLDNLINSFRRSQSFNLADLGAVALTGPAGILYTKGSDYAMILTAKKGDSTSISKISSKWNLQDGNIAIEDVAFATLQNRVAATGWLNMKTDSLDITMAVLEQNGCSIIDQRIYGIGSEPEYGKVKVIKTLLSPVTKLLDRIVAKDCEVFYDGIVNHPKQKSE